MLDKNMAYVLKKEDHSIGKIILWLNENPQIKFVSFMGIDLLGNDIEQRIPINQFRKDMTSMLSGGVQTDGSSVAFPEITSLNNAKLDIVADLDCNWYVEYNNDLKIKINDNEEYPVGTLIIPCFLYHNGVGIDSRYILKSSLEIFSTDFKNLISENDYIKKTYNIDPNDIEEILDTTASELEFWVKTPNEKAHVENLNASQTLKEQYWSKLRGDVKTAVEEVLLIMDKYELNPEMGHKEVGGIRASIDNTGKFNHIMEQIEVDWKYSNAMQNADNEYLVKNIIRETFRKYGLEVTFMAKPIPKVAGSGKHIHVGIAVKTKNNGIINLFSSTNDNHYLSSIGYGSLMGILKNYEVINAFVSNTTDSLNRLKPGFEAPVCTVTSLGNSVYNPSRNRSVLLGLIRDLSNPLATRFELRSPNPKTNSYLTCASLYSAMLEGIQYSITKDCDSLLNELSKPKDMYFGYLDKDREYRSEYDVFEEYTEEERNNLYGKAPKTVYENMLHVLNPDRIRFIANNEDFLNILSSYKTAVLEQWNADTIYRYLSDVKKECKDILAATRKENISNRHTACNNIINSINGLVEEIFYGYLPGNSPLDKLILSSELKSYESLSEAKIEIDKLIEEIRTLYSKYKKYAF